MIAEVLQQAERALGGEVVAEQLVPAGQDVQRARAVEVEEVDVGDVAAGDALGEVEHEALFHRPAGEAVEAAQRDRHQHGDDGDAEPRPDGAAGDRRRSPPEPPSTNAVGSSHRTPAARPDLGLRRAERRLGAAVGQRLHDGPRRYRWAPCQGGATGRDRVAVAETSSRLIETRGDRWLAARTVDVAAARRDPDAGAAVGAARPGARAWAIRSPGRSLVGLPLIVAVARAPRRRRGTRCSTWR